MGKNCFPNGGDNNDNGDNVYGGMVATLVHCTARTGFRFRFFRTGTLNHGYGHGLPVYGDSPPFFFFPQLSFHRFSFSRPHIRFHSISFRWGIRKTMGAGSVDSYFDLCEIVAGVLRPKVRVKGAKRGPWARWGRGVCVRGVGRKTAINSARKTGHKRNSSWRSPEKHSKL